MKQILREYKNQINYFISNKKYIITLAIVWILSYGFTISHSSIGIDDLCFDRYVTRNIFIIRKKMGNLGFI